VSATTPGGRTPAAGTGGASRSRPGGLPAAVLRSAPGTAALVAIVVAIMAFALAAGPLWFDRSAGAALPAMLGAVSTGRLGLEFEQQGRIAAGTADPMGGVAAAGDVIRAALPPSILGSVGERVDVVDSAEYPVLDPPVTITRLTLRVQPSAATGITYTAGRAPTGTAPPIDPGAYPDGTPVWATVYEAAVSNTTADELNLHVGDTLSLLPSQNSYAGAGVVITGLFDVNDPEDPRWFSDATLEAPVEVRVSSEVTLYHAVALLSPDAYPTLIGAGADAAATPPSRYRWRFPVDPAAAGTADPTALAADLATLEATYPYPGGVSTPGLSTGLPELLDAYQLQRQVADTAFLLAGIGPLVAGAGIVALVAAALARRQRPAVLMARARGAGRMHLLLATAEASIVLAVVPAALGAGLAALVATGAGSGAAVRAAIVVALASMAILVAVTLPALRGTGSLRGRTPTSGGAARSRRVAEVFVVVVALAGAVLLRTRGGAAAGGSGVGVAAAGVPVLLALAGGIVVIRLFDAAVAGIGRLAARGRGLAGVHALRGLRRGAGGHDAALVILVVAVTAGVLSTVIAASLDRSQGSAAADEVGADYRISTTASGGFPTGLDLAALGSIGPTATITATGANLAAPTIAITPVGVVGLDPEAYRRVVDGTLVDPGLDAALATVATGPGAVGTPSNPVPLVVSGRLAGKIGLAPGTALTISLTGTAVPAVVSAVVPVLTGLPASTGVVVRAGDLRSLVPNRTLPVTTALVRAPPSAAGDIGRVVAPYAGQLEVASRADVLATIRSAPLAATIRDGFRLALLLSAAFAVVVIVAALAQSLALRAREVLILRSLGMPGRDAAWTVVAAVGLTVVVAMAAGLALGAGVAWLAVPDLGVERLAGTSAPAVPVVDATSVLPGVLGPAVAGIVAVVAGLLVAGRAGAASPHLLADEP
jgi:putative ABC transport system permease protein